MPTTSRKYLDIDFQLIIPVLILLTAGLFAIYSSTVNVNNNENFYRQLIWVGVGLALSVAIYFLNTGTFHLFSIFIYVTSIVLLILVLVIGKKVYGAQSWLFIGPIGLQPSEFAKYTTILMFASYFSSPRTILSPVIQLLIGLGIILLPAMLILSQPDLGTALVFLGMTIPLLFWIGFDDTLTFLIISPIVAAGLAFLNFYLFIFYLIVAITIIFIYKMNLINSMVLMLLNTGAGFGTVFFIEKILQPHQRQRLEVLLNPNIDPYGAGYNVIQSVVAIGSGGLFGKGFMNGTQTQLGFLPKQWTDFIFCVIAEEYGVIGAGLILLVFFWLFLRLYFHATTAKNRFVTLFFIGSFLVLFIHTAINIGMTMGLLPIIGIPLPFVSYGGSAIITFMVMIGTLLALASQKRDVEIN